VATEGIKFLKKKREDPTRWRILRVEKGWKMGKRQEGQEGDNGKGLKILGGS